MKKILLLATICLFVFGSTCVYAVSENAPAHQTMTKEEFIKQRKAREAAFEQKLGLTEAQKLKAKELRIKGHEKMKPVMDEIKSKKEEAKMVRYSKMAIRMQNERLDEIDKELQVLEKKANEIRKQNMKDFESILTRNQRKILKQMKQEGRKKFEQERLNK